jgi:hypothetical protein
METQPSPTRKSRNLLLKNIKIRNKTSEPLTVILNSDPNAMIVRSAELHVGTGGGGGGVERERAIVIQGQVLIPPAGELVYPVDNTIYVTIFRKVHDSRFQVICNNYKMNIRDRCALNSLDHYITEVSCIETMQRYEEPPAVEPASTPSKGSAKANLERKVPANTEEDILPSFKTMTLSFSQEVINALSQTNKNGKPRQKAVEGAVSQLFEDHNYILTNEIQTYLCGLGKSDFSEIHEKFKRWGLV